MRLFYLVVMVALTSAACSSFRVRCDTRLRPINMAPPAAAASTGRNDASAPKSAGSADRSRAGAKP